MVNVKCPFGWIERHLGNWLGIIWGHACEGVCRGDWYESEWTRRGRSALRVCVPSDWMKARIEQTEKIKLVALSPRAGIHCSTALGHKNSRLSRLWTLGLTPAAHRGS